MIECITNIIIGIWQITGVMAPYLIFGFLMAGIISTFLPTDWLERHLGGSGLWPITKASLLGVPLPLCSCSVIPVAVSLRSQGASTAATTSFLLSTPQTGVDSILVSYALLGPFFAIFRPLAALLTGIIGGACVLLFGKEQGQPPTHNTHKPHCCAHKKKIHRKFLHGLYHGFIAIPQDIGIALFIGIVIAGTMTALVPPDLFAGYLGGGIIAIIIMMLMGVPLYVCATASVPIALGLIHAGASPGAAIAFLIAGPATNAATFTTIWKTMGMRTSIIYIATVMISALSCGLIIDSFFSTIANNILTLSAHTNHTTTIFHTVSAVLLIAIIIVSYIYNHNNKGHHEHNSP